MCLCLRHRPCVLLLGVVLSLSWLPVTKQLYSVEFSATSSPLTLSASTDALFQLSYDSSYTLVMWVKWGLPPTATSVVAQLTTGFQPRLSVTQGTDGRRTASSSGLQTISSPVLSTSVWTHIAVSVCSVTGQLSLYGTHWLGVTVSAASFLS